MLGHTALEWIVVGAIVILLVALLYPRVQQAGPGGASRERCRSHLKSIGLALHLYHEKYGTAPPAYVVNQEGRPIHSWRVLILPFFERDDLSSLYSQYRFDEPWDGPNNAKLAEQIGDLFHCPADRESKDVVSKMDTSYVAIIGPQTYWRGEQGVCPCDVYDDMKSTLQLVEVTNSGIHWMEPRDLHVGQMAPTINPKAGQGISSRHKGGAIGLFADGSNRFLSEKLSAEAVHGLLTIQGGETIPEDF